MISKIIKTALLAVFLISVCNFDADAKMKSASPATPDFAYPKSVARDARISLENSLKSNDPVETLKSLLDLTVAENLVNSENTLRLLPQLDSIARTLPSPYSGLGFLIEAQIYSEIYNQAPVRYNDRILSAQAPDTSPLEWSREMFADKIGSLLSAALDEKGAAEAASLSHIFPILSPDESAESFSIYDFMVYKVIAINASLPSEGDIIPFFKSDRKRGIDPEDLIDQLLTLHPQPSDARNTAILAKLNLLAQEEAPAFLWSQITDYSTSPFVAPLLSIYYSRFMEQSRTDTFYAYISRLKKESDNSGLKADIEKLLNVMEQKSVSLVTPSLAQSGKEITINGESSNLNEFYLLVLKAEGATDDYLSIEKSRKLPVVSSEKITLTGTIPFTSSFSHPVSFPNPGKYVVVASTTQSAQNLITQRGDSSLPVVNVADIDIISVNPAYEITASAEGVFVVNSADCKPIEGASVTFRSYQDYGSRKSVEQETKTDSEGFAPSSLTSGTATAKYNGSELAYNIYKGNSSPSYRRQIRLFPSQAVYRPGDTVEFLGIVYGYSNNSGTIIPNLSLKATFRNVNYEVVDTITLISDNSGRMFGQFKVPETGLLGRWTVECGPLSPENNFYPFSIPVEVAEYKAPSFFVSLEKGESNASEINFEGLASTYSGMPVGFCEINYTVSYQPSYFYRWRGKGEASYSSTAQTGADGKFAIRLPLDNLDPKEYRGIFTITASATDGAGETVYSTPLRFWISESFNIIPDIPAKLEIGQENFDLKVRVTDPLGLPAMRTLDYQVLNQEDSLIASGSFVSPVLSLSSSLFTSGEYIFKFRISGDEDSDWATVNTVLYRNTDRVPPTETALWVPETRLVVPSGLPEAEIRFGSSFPGQHILCIIMDSKGEFSRQWIESDGLINSLKVTAPDDGSRRFVRLLAYRDHKFYQEDVTLIPESQTREFVIKTESFRDAVSAGNHESWRFSLNLGSLPVKGYSYALLYDKAMDAVLPLHWNSSLFSPQYPVMISLFGKERFTNNHVFRLSKRVYPEYPQLPAFDFQTYGYPLYSSYSYRQPRMYASSRTAGRINDAAMPMAAEMADMKMAKAEIVTDDIAADMEMEAGTTEEAAIQSGAGEETVPVRPIEMPVAFFKPDLSSNPHGMVSVDFVVPDFNTTWKFLMGAYTDDLHSSQITLETVAAKKIMVKMNAPRFLRTGDSALLTATLYNNSTESIAAHGVYEIFNPQTGETFQRFEGAEIVIAPSGNSVFGTEFFCPTDISALGLRVYGLSESNSDGEQTVIPVLPSSQPVTESSRFYLDSDQSHLSMAIPEYPEDASVTFTYCDNPVWEVVCALSPIVKTSDNSLTGLLQAFYADCVGAGIISRYPQIRHGLQLITSGEAGDSLLVSNLQKNQDLKVVSIENTPWVNDAASENLRLSGLYTLLNTEEASTTIADIWQKILNLRNSDGGWSWCKGMDSSAWITQNLLLYLGHLKSTGFLPEIQSINLAISSAISFCERAVMADYNKYGYKDKEAFSKSIRRFIFIRSLFPEVALSNNFALVYRNAVNVLQKSWKEFDIEGKADLAMLLYRENKLKTAVEILESLKQFMTIDGNGARFENLNPGYGGSGKLAVTARVLDAFELISPADRVVHDLQKWLILQKQTQDWQEGSRNIYAISSLLASAPEWSEETELPQISIGGATVAATEIERLTGSCTVDVDLARLTGRDLEISRSAKTPAWGGFLAQFIRPMDDISAVGSPELRITKEYTVVKINETGSRTGKSDNSLKVGDNVRVTLTVVCDRDLDFVVINDERPSCLEPKEQLSGYKSADSLFLYEEVRNSTTNLFIPFMPKGTYVISYEAAVSEAGTFSGGIATIQSLYSPLFTAHSSGQSLTVK